MIALSCALIYLSHVIYLVHVIIFYFIQYFALYFCAELYDGLLTTFCLKMGINLE